MALLAFSLLAGGGRATAAEPPSLSPALAALRVAVASGTGETISGYLYRPPGDAPQPAVLMLHGCSGLLDKRGDLKSRETMWRDLLLAEGYVVLLLDSFTDRGIRSLCRVALNQRPVEPHRERPHDAYGALRWLQAQPFVKPDRIALAGWSNGAMTMLWTLAEDAPQRPKDLAHEFRAAIGFYPGCITLRKEKPGYRAAAPTLLQIGASDDWTLPKPCSELAADSNGRGGARIDLDAYDGAYHNFDSPNSKPREITVSNNRRVHVGSHPEARARAIERVRGYLRAALRD